jgi:hypothetical protein
VKLGVDSYRNFHLLEDRRNSGDVSFGCERPKIVWIGCEDCRAMHSVGRRDDNRIGDTAFRFAVSKCCCGTSDGFGEIDDVATFRYAIDARIPYTVAGRRLSKNDGRDRGYCATR